MSTDKTILSPISFLIEFFLALKVLFTGHIRSLHFALVIPGFASNEAIRSVTHQVLAQDRAALFFFL
jgi:hypothetical protein